MDLLKALGTLGGSDRYVAGNACLTDDPVMISMYVATNIVIAGSLLVISSVLFFGEHAPSAVRPIMKKMMGALFFAIGMNYITTWLVMYTGAYRVDVWVRGIVGAMSMMIAAVALKDSVQKEE